jgi:hypothetical protein
MKKSLFPFLLVLAALSSCTTDFEVLAPYKETTVVYGLLNPDTNTQVIRINKAFLGDGNAFDMAKIRDSVNYKPGELDVTIQKMRLGNPVGAPIVFRDSLISTLPGTFSTQQMIYISNQKLFTPMNSDTLYQLTIKNKTTGKEVTAETPLLGRLVVQSPGLFLKLVEPDLTYTGNSTITWLSVLNGRQYKVVLRFFYTEILKADTSQKTVKYVDLDVGTYQQERAGESIRATFPGELFYKNLQAKIPFNPAVTRKMLLKDGRPRELQIRFTAITPDFYNYVEINKPSSGIVQDKPEYTNIKGGLGFFSCRTQYTHEATMDKSSTDKLFSGEYTNDLGFVR